MARDTPADLGAATRIRALLETAPRGALARLLPRIQPRTGGRVGGLQARMRAMNIVPGVNCAVSMCTPFMFLLLRVRRRSRCVISLARGA